MLSLTGVSTVNSYRIDYKVKPYVRSQIRQVDPRTYSVFLSTDGNEDDIRWWFVKNMGRTNDIVEVERLDQCLIGS